MIQERELKRLALLGLGQELEAAKSKVQNIEAQIASINLDTSIRDRRSFEVAEQPHKRTMSAKARAAISRAQRKRWAKVRKATR